MLNANKHDVITGRWLRSDAPSQEGVTKPPRAKCSLCDKESETKGMCAIHYRAQLRVAKGIKPQIQNAKCRICRGEHVAMGLCQKHYNQEQNKLPRIRFRHFLHSAKKNGRTVSVTFKQYLSLIKMPCHYCGATDGVISGSGLDRVESSGNYDINNVVPCCWTCNFMKRDLSVASWIAHIQKILFHMRSIHHPDKGGNAEQFYKISRAIDAAQNELRA